jgi:hypothetical protein
VLHQQLGFSVCIGRQQARVFFDGNRFRFSVDGCGGGEDQAARPMGQDGFKQGKSGSCVVAKVDLGPGHGLAGLDEGGKVENTVKRLALLSGGDKKVLQQGSVREIAFDEIHPWGKIFPPAMAQVIENSGFMTLRYKEPRNGTTYIPGTSGNHYLHKNTVLSIAL